MSDLYSTFELKALAPCNLPDFAVDMEVGDTIDVIEGGADLAYISASEEVFEFIKNGTLDLILQPTDLRIKKYIRPNQPIDSTDFSLLDLTPDPWIISRGSRNKRIYRGRNDEIVIIDQYTYTYTDEGRSVDGFTREVQWIDDNGDVGHTKDTSGIINPKRLKQLNRDLRQGRIDYLEASAEELRYIAELSPEPYKSQYLFIANSIDLLFSHYSEEVFSYISRGTIDFENAIINESNPQILQILAIPVAPPSQFYPQGLTVRTSFLYQMRGWIDVIGDTPGT